MCDSMEWKQFDSKFGILCNLIKLENEARKKVRSNSNEERSMEITFQPMDKWNQTRAIHIWIGQGERARVGENESYSLYEQNWMCENP